MKRVMLIAGAGGMLGRDLVEALADDFDLVPMDHAAMDITDLAAIKPVLRKVKPDIVVNAAAMTAVDGCEKEPDQAFLVNTLGARNLAVAAERFGSELVQVSTDYVFDGTLGRPYTEWDPITPVGAYGRSKAAAEGLVRSLCRRHYILRIGILFGPHRKNFVSTVIEKAEKGEDIRVPAGRIGSPAYTFDVALAIGRIVGTERFGTMHFNQGDSVSRADLARRVLAARKLGGVQIVEVPASELGEVAPRPKDATMAMEVWRLEGYPKPRGLDGALEDFLARRAADGNVTQGKDRGWIAKGGPKPTITKKAEPKVWVPLREGGLDTKDAEEGKPPRRRFDARDEDRGGGRKPYRGRFEGGGDTGERRPFRPRYEGSGDGGARRPLRPRYEGRDEGGPRKPFRRHFEGRDDDRGERRPPPRGPFRDDRREGRPPPPRRFRSAGGEGRPPPPRRFRDEGGEGRPPPPRRFRNEGGEGRPPPSRRSQDEGGEGRRFGGRGGPERGRHPRKVRDEDRGVPGGHESAPTKPPEGDGGGGDEE